MHITPRFKQPGPPMTSLNREASDLAAGLAVILFFALVFVGTVVIR